MIDKNVVLILGAGASIPYGFPSGLKLKSEVANIVIDRAEGGFFNSFDRGEFDTGIFERFRNALAASMFTSIDAFLEERHDDYLDIGKRTIAYLLIKKENPRYFLSPIDPKEDWYQFLFNLMLRQGRDSFQKNKLSIVTFNYDRSFEFIFIRSMMASFNMAFSDAKQLMTAIPVVHVHGQLGELSEDDTLDNARAYSTKTTPAYVRKAANGIKIISEIGFDDDSDDMAGFRHARGLIQKADEIVFLGFGYHPNNVERFKFHSFAEDLRAKHARIWGSTMGHTVSELDTLVHPLFSKEGVNFGLKQNHGTSCLNFIKNNLAIFVQTRQD